MLKDDKEIEEEVLSFFFALYGLVVDPRPFLDGLDWSPISSANKAELDSPFTLEEIRRVVFGFDRNKALGPNEFSMAFFQDNRECIKEDLWRVFIEFYDRGVIDSSLNETFVCLIP